MSIKVYHFNSARCFNELGTDFISPGHMELHNKIVMFGKPEFIAKAVELGLYEKVAEVTGDELESAFERTNHIDSSWTKNEGVTVLAKRPRSTSVGDILVDEYDDAFIVASCGFERANVELK